MQNALRCGRISYTNDLPLYAAFDEGVLAFPGELIEDVPTALNQALLEGRLDCGPISSAFYAKHPAEFVLLPGVCIGSRRQVLSICCVSQQHPRELAGQRIAATKESETGRILFETICKTWYDFSPQLEDSDDPIREYLERSVPCLLIGDKAIDATQIAPAGAMHDLGELWNDFTEADMVYAVWAARREAVNAREPEVRAVLASLQSSLDWGLQMLPKVIARAQRMKPRANQFYASYYHTLNFHFDDRAQEGLLRFFSAASQAGVLPPVARLEFLEASYERV